MNSPLTDRCWDLFFWMTCKLGWYHPALQVYNQTKDIISRRCAVCRRSVPYHECDYEEDHS